MRFFTFVTICYLLASCSISLLSNPSSKYNEEHSRVIITTDIGGTDPDDEQSMVHLLMMSNEVDIEGLICQMAFCKSPIGIKTLQNIIDAYDEAYPNLVVHDPNYPSADYLRSIATTGQTEVGMSGVGPQYDTPGSELIIKAVDRKDDRPIWLTAWGGMNTIAQALWKVKTTRDEADVQAFISKIRIYDILGQCDAGAWIAKTFPQITYIRARDVYGWAPGDSWTSENIQMYPPMGAVYPKRVWATEGDSPSFLYLVNNGLNMPDCVGAGGWGGRFSSEKSENIRGMDWVVRNNLDETQYDPYYMFTNPAGESTISRWSDAIHNDFAARIQWSVKDKYETANHHPVVLLRGESKGSRKVRQIDAKVGESIIIDASKSFDPDGNNITWKCYLYSEASYYKGDVDISSNRPGQFSVVVPGDAKGKILHLILEVIDDGTPKLTSYRRIVVRVGDK